MEVTLLSSEAKTVPSLRRRPNGLVTNVCVAGMERLRKMRAKILNQTPRILVCDWVVFVLARIAAGWHGTEEPIFANTFL